MFKVENTMKIFLVGVLTNILCGRIGSSVADCEAAIKETIWDDRRLFFISKVFSSDIHILVSTQTC